MRSGKSKRVNEGAASENEMLFQSKSGIFGIKISSVSVSQMLEAAMASGRKETGGILLGYYSAGRDFAIVTQATRQPIDSTSGLFSFSRGIRGIQSLLDCFWKRGEYYLGEWHFHPYSSPTPSATDCSQMVGIAITSKAKCPEPILLIVGGNPKKERNIAAFVFPGGKRPVKLIRWR